jgi:hypothetical protein
MTAHAGDELRMKLTLSGPVAVRRKPFREEELLAAVEPVFAKPNDRPK